MASLWQLKSFPPELVIMIFEQLPMSSHPAIRQTCRAFNNLIGLSTFRTAASFLRDRAVARRTLLPLVVNPKKPPRPTREQYVFSADNLNVPNSFLSALYFGLHGRPAPPVTHPDDLLDYFVCFLGYEERHLKETLLRYELYRSIVRDDMFLNSLNLTVHRELLADLAKLPEFPRPLPEPEVPALEEAPVAGEGEGLPEADEAAEVETVPEVDGAEEA